MYTTKLIARKGDSCIAVAFEKRQKFINPFQKNKRLEREYYLCHRYARYLLESGTGLRFISALFVHNIGKIT